MKFSDRKVSLKKTILCFFVLVLFAGGAISYVASESAQYIISPGTFIETASYVISQEGTKTIVKDGSTGVVTEYDDLITAWNWTRDYGLTDGRTWMEKVVIRGFYTISSSLCVASYTVLDLTEAKFKVADASGATPIKNHDQANGNVKIVISGGVLDGNKQNQVFNGDDMTHNGIEWQKVSDSEIRGVHLHDFLYHAVNLHNYCHDNLVTECVIYDNGRTDGQDCTVSSILVFDGCERNTVSDNFIHGNRDAVSPVRSRGIYITESLGTIVEGNQVSDCYGYGIFVYGSAHDTKVRGNTVENCSKYGVVIEKTSGSINSVTIEGNTITKCGSHGIKAVRAFDFIISGNGVHDNGGNGIAIETGCKDDTVSGNIVYDNGPTAVGIVISESEGIQTWGNRVSGHSYAIRELGTSDYNTISGNDFRDNTNILTKSGAHTEIYRNRGFPTENIGADTFPSGLLSHLFAHDLAGVADHISVAWKANIGDRDWFWSSNGTHITLTLSSASGGEYPFTWGATYEP